MAATFHREKHTCQNVECCIDKVGVNFTGPLSSLSVI